VFTPVLAKHSKSFSLIDCISVGVERMQRNFEPMRKQVETCQRRELTDVTAKRTDVCIDPETVRMSSQRLSRLPDSPETGPGLTQPDQRLATAGAARRIK